MSRPLFTTATGKPLHRTSAFRIVQRLAAQAGIDGQISPHSLRHAFATIALDAGVSLHSLQDSMGHADPRTTRRYDRARNNLQKSAGYDVARALTTLKAWQPQSPMSGSFCTPQRMPWESSTR